MKIAIVAPSHVHFIVGGAEKLWLGLFTAFNRFTQHPCELFKIPADEFSFWGLVDSYKYFYQLDLSEFDMVISSKYPAWMCQHPNHLVYLMHTLRGLYDLYGDQPIHLKDTTPGIQYVWDMLENPATDISTIFDALEYLRKTEDPNLLAFTFPGPFIRRIIHALDTRAMQKARNIMTIAETVAKRKSYFPPNASVEILYPPTTLQNLYNSGYEYFFTVSRLDYAKRIDLLIQAYLQANVQIPLKIAGTGPHEQALRNLAQGDPRIEFLGFVSDVELEKLYSRAYAVPFIPAQEDFGLITLEAMQCSKAVITCTDSGGSTEFVNDKTGYLCQPSVTALAEAIRHTAQNPEDVKTRGIQAKHLVSNITWEKTVAHISERMLPEQRISVHSRKRILALSTYPIFPPLGGGQNRMYYLYQELSKKFDIEMLSLGYSNTPRREISSNVWETTLPRTPQWLEQEAKLNAITGTSTGDIIALEHMDAIPDFITCAKNMSESADAVLLEHPYCYPLASLLNKPFIFSTHNVEWFLKKAMYTPGDKTTELLNLLYETEKQAYSRALITVFCCDADAIAFKKHFGKAPFFTINNGYDANSVPFTPSKLRQELRLAAGYNKPIVLFMGSRHKPNIESVEYLIQLAPALQEFHFIILGSVSDYFKEYQLPENMTFTGSVDDATKAHYLSIASVAVNPMFSGSGTNLKMLDFMGSGIPVVSTPIGARGHIIDDKLYLCREIDDFPKAIHEALSLDPTAASNYALTFFSWHTLGRCYAEYLGSVLTAHKNKFMIKNIL